MEYHGESLECEESSQSSHHACKKSGDLNQPSCSCCNSSSFIEELNKEYIQSPKKKGKKGKKAKVAADAALC